MKFADIPGHDPLKKNLLDMVAANRLSHALLFTGPEGNGAAALARAMGQFLLCDNPSTNDSCGICPSCVKCQTVQHPDFHFSFPAITKTEQDADDFYTIWRQMLLETPFFDKLEWADYLEADNKQLLLPVKEARSILEKLSLTPYMGGHKILLLWMPELMNEWAANALLKVLEEPPEGTVFLVVTHDPERVLVTIKSRCQTVKVNPYSTDGLTQHLIKTGVAPEMALRCAALAEGSLSEALRLGQGIEANARFLSLFIQFSRAAYKGSISDIASAVNELHELGREDQKQFISYSLHLLRQALMLNYNAPDLAHLNEQEEAFMLKFSPFINHLNIVAMTQEFNKAYRDISGNVFGRIVFMDMGVRLFELFQRTE